MYRERWKRDSHGVRASVSAELFADRGVRGPGCRQGCLRSCFPPPHLPTYEPSNLPTYQPPRPTSQPTSLRTYQPTNLRTSPTSPTSPVYSRRVRDPKRKGFPWLALLLLAASVYGFWILPRQLPKPKMDIRFVPDTVSGKRLQATPMNQAVGRNSAEDGAAAGPGASAPANKTNEPK